MYMIELSIGIFMIQEKKKNGNYEIYYASPKI